MEGPGSQAREFGRCDVRGAELPPAPASAPGGEGGPGKGRLVLTADPTAAWGD